MSNPGQSEPTNRREELGSWLPLKPDLFAILLVLLDGERHGYGIMQEAGRKSEGRTRLQPGALYRLLKKLLDGGLVEETEHKQVDDNADQRRRYYAITVSGRQVLAAEARRMADLIRACESHHLLDQSE